MKWGLPVPGLLSLLAHRDSAAEVIGLDRFPRADWPPVVVTHLAFQLMVAIGTALALLGGLWCWYGWRDRWPRWLLWAIVGAAPLGMVAIEAGWVVTEVGRQPWIIYGLVRTKDAVTPVPGMVYHFGLFLVLYLALAAATVWLLRRQILAGQRNAEAAHD
jgi:cytochrome d ubiquinol oxidase subunit I